MQKELSLSLIKTACVLWIAVASNKNLHAEYLRLPDKLYQQLSTVPQEILSACPEPQDMENWKEHYTQVQGQIFDMGKDEIKAFNKHLEALIGTSVEWKCCIECTRTGENHPIYLWIKEFLEFFETEEGRPWNPSVPKYRDRSLSTSDLDKLTTTLFP